MPNSSIQESTEKYSLYLKKYFQVFDEEPMLNAGSAWLGHLAFARWIVDCVKPRSFVELGVHTGVSYCTFCQAVKALSLNASCYGVDTWQGDAHSGKYPAEILAELRAYHDSRYAAFSRLIQSTFDEALSYFPDQSVDLLHIDGLHTYEAVQHDLKTWLPKLSARAIVLFHDTNVRENQFGVWKFWEEARQNRPHFTFYHGHGLGVLGVGAELPPAILPLFKAGQLEQITTRIFFSSLSQSFAIKVHSSIENTHLQNVNASLSNERTLLLQEKAQTRDELSFLKERFQTISTAQEGLIKQVAEISHRVEIQSQNNLREVLFKLEEPVRLPSPFKEFLYNLLPLSQREAWKRKRLNEDIQYLKKSPFFDPLWYLGQNPDVQEAGLDAVSHFVVHGEIEGRKPTEEYELRLHLARAISYRKLAFTGSYYVEYLKALQKSRGYIDTFESEKKLAGHQAADSHFNTGELFESSPARRHDGPDKIDVLFIGHDASFSGAPIALFELIQQLTQDYPINARIVFQNGGPMLDKFKKLGPVLVLANLINRVGSLDAAARLISEHFVQLDGSKLALLSTAAIDNVFYKYLSVKRVPAITWIQEMPESIERYFGGRKKMQYVSQNSAAVIFVSALNLEQCVSQLGVPKANVKLIKYGVRFHVDDSDRKEVRESVRKEFNLPMDARIVLGCGTVEHRKGSDLFLQVAKSFLNSASPEDPEVYFVWIGRFHSSEYHGDLSVDIEKIGLKDRVLFVDERKNSHQYFKASDAFLFTSRSESFGLVAAEAIAYGVPVLGFENATGAAEYFENGYGSKVPYLDIHAMATELRAYLLNKKTIKKDGAEFIAQELSLPKFASSFYEEFGQAVDTKVKPPSKTVLVISGGCPPLCGHRVEGGGLRAWGLARSIKRLLPECEVTLAYIYKLEDKIASGYYDDVFVTEWSPGGLQELVGNFSTIVMSYCMGDHSKNVAEWIKPQQQLILDCYVPIYVEICARKSEFIQQEYDNLMRDIPYFNETLKRGDYFLCANLPQYDFYRGVLSALGRVNPKTYHDTGMRIVPYGIDSSMPVAKEQPIKKLLGSAYEKSWKILWFGAVYPWFNIKVLIDAIQLLHEKHPTQMIMVGAKNPFVGHPDFIEKSRQVETLISAAGVKDIVHPHDWVPFEDRADWYLDCDLIITLNEPGMENGLSWRTRVADYVWAGMPIASNGGDPLTDDLIARGAAGRLDISSPEDLSESIYKILADTSRLNSMKSQMLAYRPTLYWDNVIKPLGEIIQNHSLAGDRT